MCFGLLALSPNKHAGFSLWIRITVFLLQFQRFNYPTANMILAFIYLNDLILFTLMFVKTENIPHQIRWSFLGCEAKSGNGMEGRRTDARKQASTVLFVGNTNLVTEPAAGSVTLVLLAIVDAPLTQQSDFGCIVGLGLSQGLHESTSGEPVPETAPLRHRSSCACASLSRLNRRSCSCVTPDSSHRRLLFLTAYHFFVRHDCCTMQTCRHRQFIQFWPDSSNIYAKNN